MPASYSLGPEVEGGVATCSGAFGCAAAVAGAMIAFLLWSGLSAGLLFAPRVNVRAALAALGREREAVIDEREALSTFAADVESIPAPGPTPSVEAGGAGVVSANSQSGEMATLRKRYRETVMAVDHYERDYGESFPEHLANEFGDGVAGAVVVNDGLSPQVKRAVLSSAEESRKQRNQYLDTLDRERRRLESAGDALERTADHASELDGDRLRRRSFEELQERYSCLEDARQSVKTTLERRQEQLHEGVTFGWQRRDTESVYRYLYRDLDATYPVLADGARVLDRIDTVEHRLTTALTAKA
ncbi:DUF7260 family protein [Halolamina salifodinae]|uniref:DUF7260 domain-containing protein n=1 Tax=Halolamina salifodinae TaxID=1202767 RepID=A0A8T4GYX4_9EURY|nr:hypothetical protein [Halolamina salifodinae]MBP1987353.1 hypothetical protein [Halolamina salifodinae]